MLATRSTNHPAVHAGHRDTPAIRVFRLRREPIGNCNKLPAGSPTIMTRKSKNILMENARHFLMVAVVKLKSAA